MNDLQLDLQIMPKREDIERYIWSFQRTEFIYAVARAGCNVVGLPSEKLMLLWLFPWNLIDMVDVVICRSIDDGTCVASYEDIRRISYLMHNCDKSALAVIPEDVNAAIAAMCYQQLPLNTISLLSDGLRLIAILDCLNEVENKVLCGDNEVSCLLGGSARETFAGIAVLDTLFTKHRGIIPKAYFDVGSENMSILSDYMDINVLEELLDRLSSDIPSYQVAANEGRRIDRPAITGARFIPLHSSPIIRVEGNLVSPVAGLIAKTLQPQNVFYKGLETLGINYAGDVGRLFQVYVGKQLNSIPDTMLYPEFEYHDGKFRKDSIDWFIKTPSCLYLIEVKASTVPLGARFGSYEYREKFTEVIGSAALQIESSARKLMDGKEEFKHLPRMAMRGIIVTLDEYFFSNTPLGTHASIIPGDGLVSTITLPIQELESLVTYSQTASYEEVLNSYFTKNPNRKEPRQYFSSCKVIDNPILEECYDDFKQRIDHINKLNDMSR